ncbi:hypothetical protein LTR16_012809, partial [Cryomyces antarcticus]
ADGEGQEERRQDRPAHRLHHGRQVRRRREDRLRHRRRRHPRRLDGPRLRRAVAQALQGHHRRCQDDPVERAAG